MLNFLILRLDGPMQAWGTHTFEDFRPSNLYPTRSGLLGLLGACLGVERGDLAGQTNLAASVEITVRVDSQLARPGKERPVAKPGIKLPDFHTVMDARKVDGSKNEFPVVSRREYLFDAAFTVAVGSRPGASVSLEQIAEALRRPCYTPALGRRSCPLTRPLLEGQIEAASARDALATTEPKGGLIYSETETSDQPVRVRDVPMHGKTRQFATRLVYLHKEPKCS
ncbi:MAG: type I-E CRISPR-associated protein Cas5/CasD [Burkholderiales bacterium]